MIKTQMNVIEGDQLTWTEVENIAFNALTPAETAEDYEHALLEAKAITDGNSNTIKKLPASRLLFIQYEEGLKIYID